MLRSLIRHLPGLVLLAAVIFPSIGPLVDHHFAEHQAYHSHVGLYHYHTHNTLEYGHSHDHQAAQDGSHQAGPVMLYSYDSGPASGLPILVWHMESLPGLSFEPTSTLLLPLPPAERWSQSYISPPSRPPAAAI